MVQLRSPSAAWDLLGISHSLCPHARRWMGARLFGIVTAAGSWARG
jgi:hypothetical protein